MAQDCPRYYNERKIASQPIQKLSDVFKNLRQQNDRCNSKWGSEYHLIMRHLGLRLADASSSKEELLVWLGDPDYQSSALEAIKLNDGEEIVIYHWRGWHDWLYFVIKDKQVKYSDWWFAGE